jgi:hypothetical protein
MALWVTAGYYFWCISSSSAIWYFSMRPFCARIIREFLASTFPRVCQHFPSLFFSLSSPLFLTPAELSVTIYMCVYERLGCVPIWSLIENLSVQLWGYGVYVNRFPLRLQGNLQQTQESQSLPSLPLLTLGQVDSPACSEAESGATRLRTSWDSLEVYRLRGTNKIYTG